MSGEMSVETSKAVDKFMADRGWQGHLCSACGRTFFTKSLDNTEVNNPVCGWHKCDKGTYPFRTFTKRKKMLTPAQISDRVSEYFGSAGFKKVDPRNIANFDGQTDLVIAGVQMFDDIIHHNQPIREDKVFVAQPCVRMQFQPHVESQEGTSTSFVNVCTEDMGGSFDDHLRTVDHWCTILSKLGLHMNNFTVVTRVSTNDWGTGKFSSIELFFSYGGLELGDAAYLLIPQVDRSSIPISDIGFGLERIAWAINKTDSYFDTLAPWDSGGKYPIY